MRPILCTIKAINAYKDMLLQIKSVYLTIKKDAIWNEEDFNLWRCRIHRFARGTLVCEQIPEYCIINLDKVEVSRQPSMDGQRDER